MTTVERTPPPAVSGLPLTLRDAASALHARELSSVELTTALLDRIERLNPELGAFITVTAEAALAEAEAADRAFAVGGYAGPLQGIPFATKDIIATLGAPTTANSNILDRTWGDGYDAPVVRRMRAAGAVGLGKLVLSEFAIGLPDPDTGFTAWGTGCPADHPRRGQGLHSLRGRASSRCSDGRGGVDRTGKYPT